MEISQSLRRYLFEISQTQPLDRKEELELFRTFQGGDQAGLMARERLISANMRFVLKVALSYRTFQLPLEDLINEGVLGLIKAIECFDPDRGLKFISYAVWWIKAYITRGINEQDSTIRLPANKLLELRRNLRMAEDQLEDQDRILMQKITGGISLDAFVTEDRSHTLCTDGGHKVHSSQMLRLEELLADHAAEDPVLELDQWTARAKLHEALYCLRESERTVINELFSIGRSEPKTLREVGEILGISHERVRQLRDQGLARLKKWLKRERFSDGLMMAA